MEVSTFSYDQRRSQTLDLLRFPLAIIVLLIHVWVPAPTNLVHEGMKMQSYPIFDLLYHTLTGFFRWQSVPIYFFISGYVFFLQGNLNTRLYLKKIQNRIKSLLIPYGIWNGLMIGLVVCCLSFPETQFLYPKQRLHLSLTNFLHCFYSFDGRLLGIPQRYVPSGFPINTALWFLRDLFLISLFTPFLQYLILRFRLLFIGLLGFLWFSSELGSVLPVTWYIHIPFSGIFFFSFGAYYSLMKKDMIETLIPYKKISIILYFSLGILYVMLHYYMPFWANIIKRLNIIVGLFFAYNVAYYFLSEKNIKASKFLASASFFIYISHMLLVEPVKIFLFKFFTPTHSYSLCFLYGFATIFISLFFLFLFYMLRRFMPRFLRVIAGRR